MHKNMYNTFSFVVVLSMVLQMMVGTAGVRGSQLASADSSSQKIAATIQSLAKYLSIDSQAQSYFGSLYQQVADPSQTLPGDLSAMAGPQNVLDARQTGNPSLLGQKSSTQDPLALQRKLAQLDQTTQEKGDSFSSWLASTWDAVVARFSTPATTQASYSSGGQDDAPIQLQEPATKPDPSATGGKTLYYIPTLFSSGVEAGIIKAAQFTTVSFASDSVQLYVPLGAVQQDTRVLFEESPTQTLSNHPHMLEHFQFRAPTDYDYWMVDSSTQFTQTLSIAVHYTPVAGLDEAKLTLYFYDTEQKAWVPLPTQVDTQTHVAVGQTNHFTSFALMDQPSCQDPTLWITLDGQPDFVIQAFQTACERVGLNILGDVVPQSVGASYTAVKFSNGYLVYNPTDLAAYYLPYWQYQPFNANYSWLGLPVGDYKPNGPSEYYQDEAHNFLGYPFNKFTSGFIGTRSLAAYPEPHRFFPYFFSVSQMSEAVNTGTLENPIWMQKISFGVSADPIGTGTVKIWVDFQDGTSQVITAASTGATSRIINYPGTLPPNTPFTFHLSLQRNGQDDLIGYAPCLSFKTNSVYTSNTSGSYFTEVKCGNGGSGDDGGDVDTTPPTIQFVEIWPDGNGNLSIKALITDDSGVIVSPSIKGGPGTLSMPLKATPQYGANVYSAVFSDIPFGKVVNFTITASDPSGNSASASGNSRSPLSFDFGMRHAYCTPCIGNPVVGGNKVESIPVVILPGPSASTISVLLTYNGQDSSVGLFGQGMSFPYQMSLSSHNNPLLEGVQIVYPDGHRVAFAEKGGGTYLPVQSDVYDRVEKRGSNYVLVTKLLQEYQFDSNGRLTEIRDANGNPIHLTYSGDKLTRIENVAGRGLDLTYSGQFVSAINGPEGKHFEFGYTGTRLTSFKDGSGKLWRYEYEERPIGKLLDVNGKEYDAVDYLLTSVKRPSGEEKNREKYDDRERVIEQWVGGKEHRTFTYSEDGHTMTVTDGYGKQTVYTSDGLGRTTRIDHPDGTAEFFDYDAKFNRTYYKDQNGKEWRWTYDNQGNRLTEDGPMGSHREWIYNNLNKVTRTAEKIDATRTRVYTFEYDPKGNLTKACDPYGCSTLAYDSRGLPTDLWDADNHHTVNAYNDKGDLVSITNPDGEKTELGYDAAGRRVRMQMPLGQAYTYTFNGGDLLLAVDGPLGYHLSYGYNDNGKLILAVDAEKHETRYTVNGRGEVTRVEKPLNAQETAVETYTFGDMGELTGYTDAEGRVWTYQYDVMQRMTDTFGPLSTHIHLVLDKVGNVTDVTDAEGRVTHTEYDALYHPVKVVQNYRATASGSDANITTSYQYTLTGDVLKETDPENNSTTYEVDLLGRITLKRDAENQEWSYTYNRLGQLTGLTNPLKHTTSYTYTPAGRLESLTDALQQTTHLSYTKNGLLENQTDPLKVVTHSTYDDLGRRVSEIRNYLPGQAQDEQTNVTATFGYDLNGNLRFIIDPDQHQAEIRYDYASRVIEKIDFGGGHTWYAYDKVGNQIKVTDDNQHSTIFTFNVLDQNTVITNPEGHAVHFTYNKVGVLTGIQDARLFDTSYTLDGMYRVVNMTDAMKGVWSYQYNKVGKVLVETNANRFDTTYTYDKVYRLKTVKDAEGHVTATNWDADSNLVEVIDGNLHHTTYGYDVLDRLTSLTNPEKETTQYRYDAMSNQTQLIEADNTVTLYGYDPLYRLTSVTENYKEGGAQNNDTNVVTRYAYTATGYMQQITNANEKVTTFTYDGMGRVIREVDPLKNAWNYTFDGVGNLKTRLDAKQQLTTYAYHPDNKLKSMTYPDGKSVSFDYDPNNNLIAMRDAIGLSSWVYDPLNRPTVVKDGFSRVLKNGYDAVGNRTEITYNDGGKVQYAYLKNNWLRSMTDPASNQTQYTRDGVGNITQIAYPNTVVSTIGYDAANRVLHIDHQQTSGAQKTIAAFDYTYNEVGHVTQIDSQYAWRKPSNLTEKYTYDGLHRLAGMQDSDGVVMGYTYDRVGNRLTWTTNDDLSTNTPRDGFSATYTYNDANQVTQSEVLSGPPNGYVVTTLTYDANGNRTNKEWNGPQGTPVQGVDYAYDFENHLTTALDYQHDKDKRVDRAITTYEYNGQGIRMAQTYDPKTGSGGQKRIEYVFDGMDPVAEYSMLNGQRDDFYRGGMGRIETNQHFPSGTDGQMFWYNYNDKGDVVGLTKQSGQSTHNYRYDPFGAVLPDNGNFTDPHNHYTLTGKELDENTGLTYFGARFYDAATAQWMTQDTYRGVFTNPKSIHRYSYVEGNPITYYDAYGYWPEFLDKAVDAVKEAVGSAVQGVQNFYEENKQTIATVASAVAGVAAGVAATAAVASFCAVTAGIGCVILAGAAAGAAAGAVSSVVGQGISTGKVDGGEVLKSAVIGGITGAFTAGLSSKLPGLAQAIAGRTGPILLREGVTMLGSGLISGIGNVLYRTADNLLNGSDCDDWDLSDDFGQGFGSGLLTYGAVRLGQYGLAKYYAGKNPYNATHRGVNPANQNEVQQKIGNKLYGEYAARGQEVEIKYDKQAYDLYEKTRVYNTQTGNRVYADVQAFQKSTQNPVSLPYEIEWNANNFANKDINYGSTDYVKYTYVH